MTQNLSQSLGDSILELAGQADLISGKRKKELDQLASQISTLREETGSAAVTFVCTHNSRRSQLSELWLRTASKFYLLEGIAAFSGGTASTAFNHRMVAALKRFGFQLHIEEDGENPLYIDGQSQQKMFSKKYDDPFNPQQDYIAVMVCDQADRDCPFVPGAWARVSLPFIDPKVADGTGQEGKAYDDKVREIGREILYVANRLF